MRTLIALGISLALCACATPNQKPTSSTEQLSDILLKNGFSAIVGGCVIHQEVGSQTLLLEQSEALIRALRERLAVSAKQAGLSVNRTLSPLVCSDLSASDRYKLAILRGIPTEGRENLITNTQDQNQLNGADLELLNLVLTRTWDSVDVNRGNIPAGKTFPINMSPAYSRAASQIMKAEKLLIIRGLGAGFSSGKRIKGALLNSLSPVTITDGNAWAQAFPGEGLLFQAVLVDLAQNRVLWAKTSPFFALDVNTLTNQQDAWTQNLLTPLFPADSQVHVHAPASPLFE